MLRSTHLQEVMTSLTSFVPLYFILELLSMFVDKRLQNRIINTYYLKFSLKNLFKIIFKSLLKILYSHLVKIKNLDKIDKMLQ